jgi:hypothetical protein
MVGGARTGRSTPQGGRRACGEPWDNGYMNNVIESGPAQAGAASVDVTIRRAPKIPVFLVLGALVGFFGTLIVTALQPADPAIGFTALFGYFCVYGIPLGVVLGGVLAIVLDRVSLRRAMRVTAEQTTVEPEPVEAELVEIDADAEPIEGLS